MTLLGLIPFNRETNPEILSRRNQDLEAKQLTAGQRILRALDWGIGAGADDRNIGAAELLRAMILPWKVGCDPPIHKGLHETTKTCLSQMLFTAPIVALLCIYAAFVYGLLYLLLTTITSTFVLVYGFTLGSAGLAYIGLVSP